MERKHRHIVDSGLSLLAQAKMPLHFWWDAFSMATHIINRLPTSVLHTTPYELLFGKKPDYSMLHVFGCACFPCLRPYNRHKMQFRSEKCTFLGVSSHHKGYKCLSPAGRIYISRHVIFNEYDFPFATSTTSPSSHQPSHGSLAGVEMLSNASRCNSSHQMPIIENNISTPISSLRCSSLNGNETPPSSRGISNDSLRDVSAGPPSQMNTHPMLTRSKNGVFKPKTPFVGLTTSVIPREPTSVKQALLDAGWKKAMQLEYDALIKNRTWTLVPHTSSQNVVGCKWVFRTKLKADGSVDKLKARLVAKGYL